MQEWEYILLTIERFETYWVVRYNESNEPIAGADIRLDEYLKELGTEGWEAVGAIGNDMCTLLFKRPRSE